MPPVRQGRVGGDVCSSAQSICRDIRLFLLACLHVCAFLCVGERHMKRRALCFKCVMSVVCTECVIVTVKTCAMKLTLV